MPRAPSTHVDDPKSVGRRLRSAREAAGVSQRTLAAAGACTAAYVSRIEAGERIPSLQLIHRLAQRLHVTPQYLATGVEAEPPDTLADAEVALRLGELDEARRLFSERLEEDESDPQALAGLGQLAFRLDRVEQAIELLERALSARDVRPVSAPAAVETLARAHALTGALEAAIALLERAVEDATSAGAAVEGLRFRVLLANALIDSGAGGRAEQVLAEAIRTVDELRDPLAAARVYWTQGRLHTHLKDPRLGARYIRKALDILERTEDDDYVAMAYHLLAIAEVGAGDADAALAHLEHARTLLGSSLTERYSAMFAIDESRALLALGRTKEAAAAASVALGRMQALDPQDRGRAYVLLGDVFRQSGDRERAVELLELAVELLEEAGKPYVVDAASKLADVLEESGRSQEALAVLRRAVAAGGDRRVEA